MEKKGAHMAQRVVFSSDQNLSFAKRAIGFLVVSIVILWVGCASVTRVDAGHVGVRVKLAGSSRGVQDMPTVQGWVFFNPLTEQIVQFPTSVQNLVWTASHTEGSPHDDSITFSSKEGASVNADIGIAFHIDPQMAPKLRAVPAAEPRHPGQHLPSQRRARGVQRDRLHDAGPGRVRRG